MFYRSWSAVTYGDAEHHPFDRAARDAWRHWTVDVVEGLLDRSLQADAVPGQTKLEQGALEVDGVVTDASGTRIHVEFQSRADPAIGRRMARYWLALEAGPGDPPPEQYLVLLHRGADRPGLGTYTDGTMTHTYNVIRLWQTDPERLLSRVGLTRFASLAKAASLNERAELLARAVRLIRAELPADQAAAAVAWSAQLANLYLQPDVVADVLKENDMPIDLSHTPLAIQARNQGRDQGLREGRDEGLREGRDEGLREGRDEGLREGQRDMVCRVLASRFGDPALTGRVSAIPDALLPEAVDRAVTASAGDFIAWLDTLKR